MLRIKGYEIVIFLVTGMEPSWVNITFILLVCIFYQKKKKVHAVYNYI